MRAASKAAAETEYNHRAQPSLTSSRWDQPHLVGEYLAVAACVGVDTVYRRFGGRAGLAYALLDETERQFQAAYVAGPPPLGPGAPPIARIRAFLHASVDRLDTEADLLAMGETSAPTARQQTGAYRTDRAHLVGLLTTAGMTGDLSYLAEALLAPLAAGLFLHQRRARPFTPSPGDAVNAPMSVNPPRCVRLV